MTSEEKKITLRKWHYVFTCVRCACCAGHRCRSRWMRCNI